jgi:hypothetical protein
MGSPNPFDNALSLCEYRLALTFALLQEIVTAIGLLPSYPDSSSSEELTNVGTEYCFFEGQKRLRSEVHEEFFAAFLEFVKSFDVGIHKRFHAKHNESP